MKTFTTRWQCGECFCILFLFFFYYYYFVFCWKTPSNQKFSCLEFPPPQHKWAKTSLNNIEIARVSRMLHWLTASLCGSKWYYIKVPPCLNSTKTAWTLCLSCFSVRPILLVLILEAFNVFLQNYLKVAMMLWPLIEYLRFCFVLFFLVFSPMFSHDSQQAVQ